MVGKKLAKGIVHLIFCKAMLIKNQSNPGYKYSATRGGF